MTAAWSKSGGWKTPDMTVIERNVVRAVVLDAREHILLFHTRDPTYPELGTWWELPGGGVEGGETYLDTVVRELAEEAGMTLVGFLRGTSMNVYTGAQRVVP